jgi:hypothetical protein
MTSSFIVLSNAVEDLDPIDISSGEVVRVICGKKIERLSCDIGATNKNDGTEGEEGFNSEGGEGPMLEQVCWGRRRKNQVYVL